MIRLPAVRQVEGAQRQVNVGCLSRGARVDQVEEELCRRHGRVADFHPLRRALTHCRRPHSLQHGRGGAKQGPMR
eukprot:1829331-Prymnesium_polylepis.3